jgi:hypothetical protein
MPDFNLIVPCRSTVTDTTGAEDARGAIRAAIEQCRAAIEQCRTAGDGAVTVGNADPVEDEELDKRWVPTAETVISDYNRWEGVGRQEGLESLAWWVGRLERVGAQITNQCAGDGEAEVSWLMTLSQCYAIGWDFTEYKLKARCAYLLDHVHPPLCFDTEAEREPAVEAIRQLFLRWAQAEGHTLTRCDNCGTERFDRDLRKARRLWERLEPGGEVPAGECPDCGALCCLVEEGSP